ncbi:MAG: signal peptidase II, partial [Nocardioidaceae bacterium]
MQATPGASLNTSDPSHPTGESARSARHDRCLLLLAAVALSGYAVDLTTKVLAVDRLTEGSPVRVVGDWLRLDLIRNPGAAFSTGTSYTVVLTLVAVAAAVGVLWTARRLASIGWSLGLGFLLAGVLGNLTDRIFRAPGFAEGHVVDFLRLPHWPVFNVADICINVAAVLIVVQALRGVGVDGTRAETDGRRPRRPRRHT